jgi:hypothetical protein
MAVMNLTLGRKGIKFRNTYLLWIHYKLGLWKDTRFKKILFALYGDASSSKIYTNLFHYVFMIVFTGDALSYFLVLEIIWGKTARRHVAWSIFLSASVLEQKWDFYPISDNCRHITKMLSLVHITRNWKEHDTGFRDVRTASREIRGMNFFRKCKFFILIEILEFNLSNKYYNERKWIFWTKNYKKERRFLTLSISFRKCEETL